MTRTLLRLQYNDRQKSPCCSLAAGQWVSQLAQRAAQPCLLCLSGCLFICRPSVFDCGSILSIWPASLPARLYFCLSPSLFTFSFLSSSRSASNPVFISSLNSVWNPRPPQISDFCFFCEKLSQVTSKPMQWVWPSKTDINISDSKCFQTTLCTTLFVWSIMHPLVHQVACWDI